jgi:oligopeptide/dipeptide ABC transporter ATP-binding protein
MTAENVDPSAATATSPGRKPLLEVRGLRKEYLQRRSALSAGKDRAVVVDGVDFEISPGEAWGLVGESGSGKSTTARLVLRLLPPTAGTITLAGQDITALRGRALRGARAKMQAVFQDVAGSLDNTFTVQQLLAEPMRLHRQIPRSERRVEATRLLDQVGLGAHLLDRYPYELSGGQRQRVALARALAVEPALIVLDEAVSALDVSTRAQVVNLLAHLRQRLDLAFLFIAHDLSVVHHLCDRIAVMYLGQIVESGPAPEVYTQPRHPYTQALLSAIPSRMADRDRIVLRGDTPPPTAVPSGCRFHTRCHYAFEPCSTQAPPVLELAGGSTVACHLHTSGPNLQGASVDRLRTTVA